MQICGKYNTAVVFTDNIDESAVKQIIDICNMKAFQDSKIRIMPDAHAGAGCTIGTTMTVTDKIVPNWVGVDIGCGVDVAAIAETQIDFEQLDRHIRKSIPFGHQVNKQPVKESEEVDLTRLRCAKSINLDRAYKSVMSLGGGNHYIEVNKGTDGTVYICVHTGSRHPGKQCAEHYQNLAVKTNPSQESPYLSGGDTEDYLYDMAIMQHYAAVNRAAIIDRILEGMRLTPLDRFSSVHNYIDLKNKILRKGAISAQADEKVVIPVNMRDGAIIAAGKGNADWNFSAPHGAGRVHSRRSAKESISLEEFKASMEGIWTSCVNRSTVDESPMAYKPMAEILTCIGDTVEILDIIKPLYNFKSSE